LTGDTSAIPASARLLLAAKLEVIYQLPCIAAGDRSLGTPACAVATDHALNECDTCAKEGFFAYQQTSWAKRRPDSRRNRAA